VPAGQQRQESDAQASRIELGRSRAGSIGAIAPETEPARIRWNLPPPHAAVRPGRPAGTSVRERARESRIDHGAFIS
jgi:hypothetical protein